MLARTLLLSLTLSALSLLGATARAGTLVITTPHYGSEIIIDRQPVGLAPVAPQRVSAGFHLVEVKVRRRPTWSALVFVGADAEVKLQVEYPPSKPADRIAREDAQANAPPPDAQPLRLEAEATVRGARAGPQSDIDLRHRWRLEARELRGLGMDGVVQMRVRHDLDALSRRDRTRTGSCPLPDQAYSADLPGLTDALDCDGTLFLLDEAHLRWREGPARLTLGRQTASAPGGGVQTIDGVRGRWRQRTGWVRRLELTGGRAIEPPTTRTPVDWLGHGGLGLGIGAGEMRGRLDADYTYAETHHLDLEASGRLGPQRLAARLESIDGQVSHWHGRSSTQLGALGVNARIGHRANVTGPYVLDGDALGISLLRPPRGWRLTGGITHRFTGLAGTLTVSVQGTSRWPGSGVSPAPDRPRWREITAESRWQSSGNLAVTLFGQQLWSAPGDSATPALGDRRQVRLTLEGALGPFALEGHGGVADIRIVEAGVSDHTLAPEAGAALSVPLSNATTLSTRWQTRSMPPALLSAGRQLTEGWLTLKLR
ncbi:MAG: PEGA domain-containing protein [Bradymonadia bacterium]